MVRMTCEQIRNAAQMKTARKALACAAAIPDSPLDTSDAPGIAQTRKPIIGGFARSETRQISIRLSASHLLAANRLAGAKGLPYQTYIKSLLHEALEREQAKAG
jgi:hypothetical protein